MSAVLAPSRQVDLDLLIGPHWRDLAWRLNNLYTIVDEHGKTVPFRLNEEQQEFIDALWPRNLIVKARQLGFCCEGATRVLMADLTWRRIDQIEPGDELVATDESPVNQKMRTALVEAVAVTAAQQAYEIAFSDGRSLICSGAHRWLAGDSRCGWRWYSIDSDSQGRKPRRLKVGMRVRSITAPWGGQTPADGWFGGILDGEGSFSTHGSPSVNASQRPGSVWNAMAAYLSERGYNFCIESDGAERPTKFGKTPVPKIVIGRMNELFRLLGQCRPVRWVDRRWWEGRGLPGKKTGKTGPTIVSITALDQRPLYDLQTSTKTFIAEGFVSHNSTLIQILQADQALFNANHSGVTIADSLPNAGRLFGKLELAVRKLAPELLQVFPVVGRAAKTSIEFEHGSSVYVSTSSRGGTVQLLHVSELGKIARKYPERSQEIISGAFESVPQDGCIVVESTAEGAAGDFFDLVEAARKRQLENRPETVMDWRLHFFPWYRKQAYRLDPDGVHLSDRHLAYFRKLEAEVGVTLDPAQRAWYAKKEETQGRTMKREYPSTIVEAFEQAVEGAIFGEEMTLVREQGRITVVPIDREHPMSTFWDFGTGNRTVVWAMQRVGLQNRWVRYFVADGTGLGPIWRRLEEWRLELAFAWGRHYLPHDADAEVLGESITTKRRILEALDMKNIEVVGRIPQKSTAIDLARQKLPADNWFDRDGCAEGIKCLDGYQFEWNDDRGVWSNEPYANWACLAGDTSIRTLNGWHSIESLVGKEFHVWGYSIAEKRIVPAKVERCWKAKTVDTVVRVELDSGEVITCTLDHRFLSRDERWIEAQHLMPGQSLMPFYEMQTAAHAKIHLNDGSVAYEHRYAFARLNGPLLEGMHVHHQDHCKQNNEPGNLVQITAAEHRGEHSRSPEHLAQLRLNSGRGGNAVSTAALVTVNKARAGDKHHTRDPSYWSQERRLAVGEQMSRSLKASDALKTCPACKSDFMGNFRRLYCCHNCAARAGDQRRRGITHFPVRPEHTDNCQRVAQNHKVVSIEFCDQRTDVFDISVPGIESFVANGVVVHNSHGADAWMQYAQGYIGERSSKQTSKFKAFLNRPRRGF